MSSGRRIAYFLLLSTLVQTSLLGCTRKQASKEASFSIAIPQKITRSSTSSKANSASTVTAADLAHVIINVSGQGIINPITVDWDSHPPCGTCTAPPPPTSFPVMVPTGPARLVQVLAVYQSSDGKGSFYYGDATKDLVNADETVDLSLTELGGGLSLSGGVIAGRILDQTGNGPTGRVAIKYEPTGKPSMVIEYTDIFNGWFSFFGLRDVAFKYELGDGTPLFGGPVSLNGLTASAQVLKVSVPQNYRHEQYSYNGPVTYRQESAEDLYFGYFGPGATGKKVCYAGSPDYTFTKRSLANTTPFNYLIFPGTGVNYLTPTGGDSALANCTGTEWADYMRFMPANLDRNGTHAAFGFAGLLTFTPTQPMISAQHTAGNLQLNWNFLPGVASAIQGMRLYRIMQSEREMYRAERDGMSCFKLAQLTPLGSAPSPLATLSVPFPSADLPSSLFVLCPFTLNGPLARGYEAWVEGGNNSPPTQMRIGKWSTPFSTIAQNQCTEMRLRLTDDNGGNRSTSSQLTFGINNGGTPATIYSNSSNCAANSNAITAQNLILPSNQSEFTFYFKSGATPGSSVTLTPVYTSAFLPLTLSSLTLTSRALTDKFFMVEGPGNIVKDLCYTYRVKQFDYNMNTVNAASNTTINLTGPSEAEFYTSPSCSGGTVSSVTLYSSSSMTMYYMKLVSSANLPSGLNVTASASGIDSGTMYISQSMAAATPAKLHLSSSGELRTQYCEMVNAMVLNSDNALVRPTSDITVNLGNNTFPGSYHTSSDCSAASTISSTTLWTNTESTTVYFKPNLVQGSGQLTASASGLTTGQMNVQVRGPQNLDLAIAGSIVAPGTCVGATITSRDAYNSLFTHNADFPLNLSGFPLSANTRYSDANCTISMTFKIATGQNSVNFYFIADNPTASSVTHAAMSATAAGANPSPVQSLTIQGRPALTTTQASYKIATGFDLFLQKILTPFSGVPVFTYSHISGLNSAGLNNPNATFNPGSASTDTLSIVDSISTSVGVTLNSFASVLNLDFTSGSLNGVTVSRTGPATYYNSSGVLTTALANNGRFDYDPSNPATMLGLLIEPAATNFVTNSEALESWSPQFVTVTANQAVAPDGQTTAELVAWNNPTDPNMAYLTKTLGTWNYNTDYTASIFVKKNTARFVGMKLHESGSTYSCAGIVVDLDTGNAVRMADPWPCSTNNDYGVQPLPNGWFRIWVRYHSLGGPSSGLMWLYPVYHGGTTLSPNRDNTVSGSTYFWGAQVETGPSMTSYIMTTAGAATRNADLVTLSTGTSSVSATAGTFFFEWNRPAAVMGPSSLFTIGSAAMNSHQIGAPPTGEYNLTIANTGTTVASLAGMWPKSGLNRLTYSYNSSTPLVNGVINSKSQAPFTSTFTGPGITSQPMKIGGSFTGGNALNGHIRKIIYWNTDLSVEGQRSMSYAP